ncbi:hypothetical protein GVN21_11050 [Caulobacter sp. SLTY]|uniref:tyrosine phosphatase family protein n=1 Tax=Caulobacter sp. SLTY TaxID=2683262 RepID=UPI0014128B1C|nr:hypothetical protein [Caulobacter sp. SLTY]NBB15893.1 hypothetical protein [Caulobacter sp. SLTY]
MTLIVSPLRDAPTVIKWKKPSHVITLLEEGLMSQAPRALYPDHHLKLSVHDIWEAADGETLPDEGLVRKILDFAEGWVTLDPMLVHCWAGVSRSTAAAYLIACARNPDASEAAIAQALRKASPGATPNPLIVALADDVLGRGGRMVDAVRAIGRGTYVYPGAPFEMPSRF